MAWGPHPFASFGKGWGEESSNPDAVGNIWKSGSVNFNNGYGSGNHISGFSYDGMGNVTYDGGSTYSYDAEGRPVSMAGTQVVYDAFNRAVERNSGSTHSQVVYDPQGAKFAYMSGQTLQQYVLPLVGGCKQCSIPAGCGTTGTPTGWARRAWSWT